MAFFTTPGTIEIWNKHTKLKSFLTVLSEDPFAFSLGFGVQLLLLRDNSFKSVIRGISNAEVGFESFDTGTLADIELIVRVIKLRDTGSHSNPGSSNPGDRKSVV